MTEEEKSVQTIELDCPPLTPRPDTYIEEVMKDSGVEYDGRPPVLTLFGNWTWDFSDIPAEKWKAAQPVFEARIRALHLNGAIRYGSW